MDLTKYYPDIAAKYPAYVTQRELCEICHICPKTAYNLEQQGEIPYTIEQNHLIRSHKIKLTDILAYLYRRECRQEADSPYICAMRTFYDEHLSPYLDCECTYFPSLTDDDPIMSAYNYAKRESVKEGFVPVLIKADDEILWECLIMNSDPDSDGEDDFAFDPDKVAEYRKKMLSAPVENSKAVLEEMIGQRKEEAEDDDMDWDEEILGEMEGGYDNRRFSSYWNSDNNMTYPLILAKIPVKNPWEIFAYLPFGGWNECPNTPELMAVAKYWFEQHGAVPAAMSHDELEFLLPAPVPEEKAMDAAVELYGFCPDVIDQGPEDATVGALADVLRQSTVWYFWWD